MSSEYRMVCDFCRKETKGWYDKPIDQKKLALNNWSIHIDSMWLEDVEGSVLKEMHKEAEVSLDACHECAKKCAAAIRGLVKK